MIFITSCVILIGKSPRSGRAIKWVNFQPDMAYMKKAHKQHTSEFRLELLKLAKRIEVVATIRELHCNVIPRAVDNSKNCPCQTGKYPLICFNQTGHFNNGI